MANEEWLTFAEAVALVRSHLGDASVGRSQAQLKAAGASGEVRIVEPLLLIADDGLVGMSMRPGALHKAGVTPDGKLVLHTPPKSQRQFSHDDLLDWLGRQFPAAKPKTSRKGGRPPHDWDTIEKAVFKLMDHHDDFVPGDREWNSQARLEEAILQQFDIGVSTLREHLPQMLLRWRKAKAGN